MWNTVFLTAALALGQPGDSLPDIAPVAPPPLKALAAPQFSKGADDPPPAPAALAPAASAPADAPAILPAPDQPPAAADQTPAPVNITAPLLPIPTPAAPAAAATPYKPPVWPVTHPWKLMQSLQGTYEGALMDGQRIDIYGWAEATANASSAAITNLPAGWDDRSNRVELEQFFVRIERQVVTTGTTMPTWGFRSDWLIGTDYRWTLPRGIWNSQLLNSKTITDPTVQNLYGVDPVEFYGELYVPTVLNGLDVKAGRWYAPFGYESIEAVSTPLVSRSYTFNNGPEFTNFGILATLNIGGFGTSASTPGPTVWTLCGGITNGNDIDFDAGQEPRFVGYVKWTQPGSLATPVYGRNTVTLATSLGSGKFNTSAPLLTENPAAVTTAGISGESLGGPIDAGGAAGRDNFNVIDLVYTHTFNPVLNYAAECLYGWQYDCPTTPTGNMLTPGQVLRGGGTAYWGSCAQYLTYTLSSRLTSTTRLEFFDDAQGQRTGAVGLYTEVTTDLAWKPRFVETTPYINGGGLIIRPELRWDNNANSAAFNGVYNGGNNMTHNLFTAAMDVIVRW